MLLYNMRHTQQLGKVGMDLDKFLGKSKCWIAVLVYRVAIL